MNSRPRQITLPKGTIVFNEGEPGDCAYIVEKGRVLVFLTKDHDEVPVSILGVGEIFGEMSLIDDLSRSASVRTIEDCVLSIVARDQLVERFQSSDTLVQLLLKVLMNRLRRNNLALSNSWDVAHGKAERYDIYVDENSKYEDVFENLKFENRLQEALNREEFEMFYQPILDIEINAIVGCEALIRWKDPQGGYIHPDKFIDFLEDCSLVIPVGYWILERCFRDFQSMRDLYGTDFMMSINVSGRQFTHPNFLNELEKLSWKYKIPVGNIKLEVTERVMMDGSVALDILNKCRQKGYSISIDDFGTGFSSLQYLSQMPVSYLKIDRSFVMKLSRDPKALAVVRSMIFMAKSLGMDVIAEGIETLDEREILLQLGAPLGQGWLYSKALPLPEFLKLPHQYFLQTKTAA